MSLKIGLFLEAYHPYINGVTVSVSTLKTQLEFLGHEVYIFTFDDENAPYEKEVVRFKGVKYPFKQLRDYRFSLLFKRMLKVVKTYHLDVVHSHTEFSMGRLAHLASRRFNIPHVHTYHTMYEDYAHHVSSVFSKPISKLSRRFSRRFADGVHELIVPSKKVYDAFQSYGLTSHAHIIPTGLSLSKFTTNTTHEEINLLKEKLNIKPDKHVLLFLGRMSKEKRISALISAFNKLSKVRHDVVLLIVGDGPDMQRFVRESQLLIENEKIYFAGMVPINDVAIYYQISDVFVNFSDTETQGLTYIEALASGCPLVVQYDSNLDNVVIDGYNGYMFNDVDMFIEYINLILDNSDLYHKLALNTRESILKFDEKLFGKKVLDVYKDSLNKKMYFFQKKTTFLLLFWV
jgi:1,2-diacylglycerol 3-alpha-glucosyltransferase